MEKRLQPLIVHDLADMLFVELLKMLIHRIVEPQSHTAKAPTITIPANINESL